METSASQSILEDNLPFVSPIIACIVPCGCKGRHIGVSLVAQDSTRY
jgi:hypothetical protein